jgi:hypothetical protein
MGHFGAHAETFPSDEFAAVRVRNDFDRRGVGERVIDSFAHLLEFPRRLSAARESCEPFT